MACGVINQRTIKTQHAGSDKLSACFEISTSPLGQWPNSWPVASRKEQAPRQLRSEYFCAVTVELCRLGQIGQLLGHHKRGMRLQTEPETPRERVNIEHRRPRVPRASNGAHAYQKTVLHPYFAEVIPRSASSGRWGFNGAAVLTGGGLTTPQCNVKVMA